MTVHLQCKNGRYRAVSHTSTTAAQGGASSLHFIASPHPPPFSQVPFKHAPRAPGIQPPPVGIRAAHGQPGARAWHAQACSRAGGHFCEVFTCPSRVAPNCALHPSTSRHHAGTQAHTNACTRICQWRKCTHGTCPARKHTCTWRMHILLAGARGHAGLHLPHGRRRCTRQRGQRRRHPSGLAAHRPGGAHSHTRMSVGQVEWATKAASQRHGSPSARRHPQPHTSTHA